MPTETDQTPKGNTIVLAIATTISFGSRSDDDPPGRAKRVGDMQLKSIVQIPAEVWAVAEDKRVVCQQAIIGAMQRMQPEALDKMAEAAEACHSGTEAPRIVVPGMDTRQVLKSIQGGKGEPS